MEKAVFVVVLGNGRYDTMLTEKMRDSLQKTGKGAMLSPEAQYHICRATERIRRHHIAGRRVGGLIFTNGLKNSHDGLTVAQSMERYTLRIFGSLRQCGFPQVPIVANRNRRIQGIFIEMLWAARTAERMGGDVQVEFVATDLQGLVARFINWRENERIKNLILVPEEETMVLA